MEKKEACVVSLELRMMVVMVLIIVMITAYIYWAYSYGPGIVLYMRDAKINKTQWDRRDNRKAQDWSEAPVAVS